MWYFYTDVVPKMSFPYIFYQGFLVYIYSHLRINSHLQDFVATPWPLVCVQIIHGFLLTVAPQGPKHVW